VFVFGSTVRTLQNPHLVHIPLVSCTAHVNQSLNLLFTSKCRIIPFLEADTKYTISFADLYRFWYIKNHTSARTDKKQIAYRNINLVILNYKRTSVRNRRTKMKNTKVSIL